MTDINKIKAEALEALDELNDCARMECSIEAIGAMSHMTNFVQTVCERLETAEKDAARWNHLVNYGYGWIDIWKDKYKTSKLVTMVDKNMKGSK